MTPPGGDPGAGRQGARWLELGPAAADRLFLEDAPALLVIGDAALASRFHLSALCRFAIDAGVARTVFWGRAAAHHADRFREIRALRRGRAPGPDVGACARFEPVDLMEDAAAMAAYARAATRASAALLDRGDPLERRLLCALEAEGALERPPSGG
ncbi:MAG: hypothetical protein AAFR16_03880 [Pseudomonadota bacterium]